MQLTFLELPAIFPGITTWGAQGHRLNYIISQDVADNYRFSVSAKNTKTGKIVVSEFSTYATFDHAVAACNEIESRGRH